MPNPTVPGLTTTTDLGAGVVRLGFDPTLAGVPVKQVSLWYRGVNVLNTAAAPANPAPVPAGDPMLTGVALQGVQDKPLVAELWVQYGTTWTQSQVTATPVAAPKTVYTVDDHVTALNGGPLPDGEELTFRVQDGHAVPA